MTSKKVNRIITNSVITIYGIRIKINALVEDSSFELLDESLLNLFTFNIYSDFSPFSAVIVIVILFNPFSNLVLSISKLDFESFTSGIISNSSIVLGTYKKYSLFDDVKLIS